MKAVILAGGKGTRIIEESSSRPKPMIEIGGMPIIWHIMKIYSHYGIKDFVVCCGYKGHQVKEYFSSLFVNQSDFTIDLSENELTFHKTQCEDWRVTLVDTGLETMTGGRLLRAREYLKDEEDFCFTYGDGLADIDIKNLIEFHRAQKTIATVTSVYPKARYGSLEIKDNYVMNFTEKPLGDNSRINGGFFVLKKSVFDYIDDDTSIWEENPLSRLAEENQLSAFHHNGFWSPMDTLRDKLFLEECWLSEQKFWKVWK